MRRLPNSHRTLFLALLFVAALAATAPAQAGGPYEITKPTIAGGSSTSAGGPFVIIGTMAQHDAVVGTGGPYLFDGGFWPDESRFQTPPCAADVSARVRLKRGKFHFIPGLGRSLQTVQLINVGADNIQGPISLVLDGLSANAMLFHPGGTTACALPVSPYVNVRVGRNGVFRRGERVTLVLQFNNPSHGGIAYEARVLAGTNR
ncbi:MAG: hypothetical protein ACRD9R_15160 [Pyrinomonadaceae bacterium]